MINIKHWKSIITGIIGLIIILLIGVLIGSTVGFIEKGIDSVKNGNTLQNELFNYYIKPLFWIFFIGIIPTIITGGIMGKEIKKEN